MVQRVQKRITPNPNPATTRTRSSTSAATPYRGAAHQLTKKKSSNGAPPRGRCKGDELRASTGLERRGESRGGRRPGLNSAAPSGPREVGLARQALSMLALMARSPRLALRLAWAGMLLSRERERRDSRKVKQHKASPPARLRFHTRTIMQLQSFPLRLRKLFLESGGFSKDASLIVPAGTEQGFHPCTPPGPPRPWTPPGALAPGPFLAFTPCQILQPML